MPDSPLQGRRIFIAEDDYFLADELDLALRRAGAGMLATAVALNLENAPTKLQEAGVADTVVGAVMGGESPRHVVEGLLYRHPLSTGMAAFPANCEGVPFDMSHVYASGNLTADMYCNVAAGTTGRVLAVRLSNATNDPGMKDPA